MKYKYRIWIDEAGRWSWAWPVVACALALSWKTTIESADSKALSASRRKEIFDQIVADKSIKFEVGVVDSSYIDQYWIKAWTKEAMQRAINSLTRKILICEDDEIDAILVDGNDNFILEWLPKPPIYIVRGDSKVVEISLASIVAKVFRDELMKTYWLIYPDLWFEFHAWYWTAYHSSKIAQSADLTSIHRLSYKPVEKVLNTKPKLLVHACCGPDTCVPALSLKHKYDVLFYWYDPNIQPKKEHDKRLKAFIKVCELEGIPYIIGDYDYKEFSSKISFNWFKEWWSACKSCLDMRMIKACQKAKELGFELWTTTLNASPKKSFVVLKELGYKIENTIGPRYLPIDFKKKGWDLIAVNYCKDNKIFRQLYCGCLASLNIA